MFCFFYCWTRVSLWRTDKRSPTAAWTSEWSEFWRAAAGRKCLSHSDGNQAEERTNEACSRGGNYNCCSGIMILSSGGNFSHCMWKTKLAPLSKIRLRLQSYILIYHIFYLFSEVQKKKAAVFFKTNLLHCLWILCWHRTKPDFFSANRWTNITVMSSITGPPDESPACWMVTGVQLDRGDGSTTGSLVSKTPQRLVELKVLTRYCSDLRCVATLQPPGLSHIA